MNADELAQWQHGGRRTTWGPWRLDSHYLVIGNDGRGFDYEVDLLDCTSSAAVLDWVHQIAGKNWATDEVIADLVRALDDILRPQATLCSGGRSKRLTQPRIRQLIAAAKTGATT